MDAGIRKFNSLIQEARDFLYVNTTTSDPDVKLRLNPLFAKMIKTNGLEKDAEFTVDPSTVDASMILRSTIQLYHGGTRYTPAKQKGSDKYALTKVGDKLYRFTWAETGADLYVKRVLDAPTSG